MSKRPAGKMATGALGEPVSPRVAQRKYASSPTTHAFHDRRNRKRRLQMLFVIIAGIVVVLVGRAALRKTYGSDSAGNRGDDRQSVRASESEKNRRLGTGDVENLNAEMVLVSAINGTVEQYMNFTTAFLRVAVYLSADSSDRIGHVVLPSWIQEHSESGSLGGRSSHAVWQQTEELLNVAALAAGDNLRFDDLRTACDVEGSSKWAWLYGPELGVRSLIVNVFLAEFPDADETSVRGRAKRSVGCPFRSFEPEFVGKHIKSVMDAVAKQGHSWCVFVDPLLISAINELKMPEGVPSRERIVTKWLRPTEEFQAAWMSFADGAK
ncbi:hypothetical protein FVE85_6243 [Porphyridium purpureum]|uniref:Uncharacterized protein n=1 Tax=Porphyridium purpureum TaxID=35688 RepID=A0A5J4Z608_PORPP|nr:hypothetical protein FVE85_6243 [Porphyridium purpureum]|eukprot:POR6520..scf295_1